MDKETFVSQTASRTDDNMETAVPELSSAQNGLESIYEPIRKDLNSVESILRKELSNEVPFVDELLKHSWLLGGKRIRPAFLLLCGASCGTIGQPHLHIAAALEMIHTATLIHDDILDEALTRRHRATANSTWGNKVSVLLGDYLFTHSFHIASLSESCESLRMLAVASNRVCEGEMRQNAWQGKFDLTENQYLQMITEKTAELCGVGCRLGAHLSNASVEKAEKYESYGRSLGVAFQVIDDVLDLVGKPMQVGKTLGTDLINQKPTLPVIHCLQQMNPSSHEEFKLILADPNSSCENLMPYLDSTNSIAYAQSVAEKHASKAISFAESLPSSPYASSLRELAEFVLHRSH
jgi:octaprenyl-diphosphate synthase